MLFGIVGELLILYNGQIKRARILDDWYCVYI